jgi:hypothetical protein
MVKMINELVRIHVASSHVMGPTLVEPIMLYSVVGGEMVPVLLVLLIFPVTV